MTKAEYNRQLVTEYFDLLARGDLLKGQNFWADDMVFFQAGHSRLAGEYHGAKDFLTRWLQPLLDMTNNRLVVNAAPKIILSGDDGCVVIANEHMVRDGKGRIDTQKLIVYTIRGDKFVGCRMYDSDQGAIDDFWS